MEIYQAIKQLEEEQKEILKKQQDPTFIENEKASTKELEELCEVLAAASRADSRKIKDRITYLRGERNRITQESSRIEETIKRKQSQLDKINEKLFKANIRTNMLGKDASRNEYWHFKEDPERVYIRKEEVMQTDPDSPFQPPNKVHWQYIDEEEKFDMLVESMNPKGIRERKLLESLRKCKDRLKLKKTRKAIIQDISMTMVAGD